jgi:hypothetical protein
MTVANSLGYNIMGTITTVNSVIIQELVLKNFFGCNFCHIIISLSVCHIAICFQPSLLFAGRARSLPQYWSPIRWIWLAVANTSLFKYGNNCGCKKL